MPVSSVNDEESLIEKDKDDTPLMMVLPDLKWNVKIFQLWKVGHID